MHSARIDRLSAKLQGPMFLPTDTGYDAERAGAQTFGQHRPTVIVGAATAEDVRVATAFAGEQDLPVAVQATGHGLPIGADAGLLISTRRMSGVRVDGDAGTAWIEAGARWEDVVPETARYGLAPPSGSAPHIGAVSYTLGGGVGLLSRRYGFAVDHVRSIDVVTADATPRRVTATNQPELFWALRGGRSNFGVVTGLEIDLLPVERLYGGSLFFDADHSREVVATYLRWTASLPEEMTSSLALIPFPAINGRPMVHIRIAHCGDAERGAELIEPLRAIGSPLLDTVDDMPYTASGSIHNEPTDPMGYHATNVLVGDLDVSAACDVFDRAGPHSADPCIVEVRHLGGALARPPVVPSAVGNRDAEYTLGVLSALDTDAAETRLSAIRSAHQHAIQPALPAATGGGYVNFMYGENASTEQVRTAYEPADYRRLTELKAEYDPRNLFRLNHNIPPAGA